MFCVWSRFNGFLDEIDDFVEFGLNQSDLLGRGWSKLEPNFDSVHIIYCMAVERLKNWIWTHFPLNLDVFYEWILRGFSPFIRLKKHFNCHHIMRSPNEYWINTQSTRVFPRKSAHQSQKSFIYISTIFGKTFCTKWIIHSNRVKFNAVILCFVFQHHLAVVTVSLLTVSVLLSVFLLQIDKVFG